MDKIYVSMSFLYSQFLVAFLSAAKVQSNTVSQFRLFATVTIICRQSALGTRAHNVRREAMVKVKVSQK